MVMFSDVPREPKRVRALQHDRVVVRGLTLLLEMRTLRQPVEIDAVAVGVDGQIVDGQVIHAGGQDAEMAAVQDRKIAQRHVAAELQSDGFVAAAPRSPRVSALPRDQAAADNRDVFQTLAPDQAVMEMAVAEILKLVPLVGFGRIVGGRVGICFQRGTGFELQGDIAAQSNRARDIGSRREIDGSAARGRRGIDCFVDGVAVGRFAVALRAERLHIENGGPKLSRKQPGCKRECHPAQDPTSDHFSSLLEHMISNRPRIAKL